MSNRRSSWRSRLPLLVTLPIAVAAACGGAEDDAPFRVTYRENADASFAETCGNGVREGSESCDGNDLGGKTCATESIGTAVRGTLRCTPTCAFDLSRCVVDPGGIGTGGNGTGGRVGTGGRLGTGGA